MYIESLNTPDANKFIGSQGKRS